MQLNTHTTHRPRRPALIALFVAALAAALVAGVGGAGIGSHSATAGSGKGCKPAKRGGHEISTAKLIVEYNATDGDIGVHGAFDNDGWSKLCVYDPKGRRVLTVGPKRELRDLTMAGIFFESREPPIKEFSFKDLRARFPEGKFRVRGRTFDGKALKGSATFTHDVPARPTINSPSDGAVVPRNDVVVDWKDVTRTVDGKPVKISAYEVIVTKVKHEDPHGFSQPVYDVHVPADRNSLAVPPEFLEPRTKYELEVLALEKSGNQTITVGFFKTK